MKTLGEIKQMMAASDTAQADEALKELLAKEPDNLQAKMLYGTCRQLLGDEETFKRIHDELAPVMETMPSETIESRMWAKYRTIHSDMRKEALCKRLFARDDGPFFMEYVVVAVLILLALATGLYYWGREILDQFGVASLYRGMGYDQAAVIVENCSTNECTHVVTNTNNEANHSSIPGDL